MRLSCSHTVYHSTRRAGTEDAKVPGSLKLSTLNYQPEYSTASAKHSIASIGVAVQEPFFSYLNSEI